MRIYILYILLFLHACIFTSHAQNTFTFSGTITDKKTQNPVSYANLYDSSAAVSFTADSSGFFNIKLPKGKYLFTITSIGFKPYSYPISLEKNTQASITLETQNELDEVTITSDRLKKTADMSSSGILTIKKSAILAMPQFAGENDVLKAIQQLPGVQSGYEGSRGLFVRGGSPDQTLVLFDNAPVYNSSHIYGFISIFAPDAISEAELHKSYMPANYAGRLSSVLYIEPEFGVSNQWKTDFGIGLITAKIHVQGPIKKDKTYFNFNIRECHAGLLSNPISSKFFTVDNNTGSLSYYFYDLNGAIKHIINEKNSIQLSFYHSNDFYYFKRQDLYEDANEYDREVRDRKLQWANFATSFSWNTKVKDIQVTNQLYQSTYTLQSRQHIFNYEKKGTRPVEYNNIDYINESKLYDIGISSNWKKSWNHTHILQWGLRSGNRVFVVNNAFLQSRDTFNVLIDQDTMTNPNVYSSENYIYADYKFLFKDKFQINAGLQGLWYFAKQQHFGAVLPRAQFIYYPVKGLSLRTAFIQNSQNIHLLTGVTGDVQNDLWVPATGAIRPEKSWQYSAGVQYNFEKGYIISTDAFYRKMKNLVEYKYGYAFLLDFEPWENQLLNDGTGRSYGMEFYAAKNKGQFNATVKYNLSWSRREFDGLNDGKPFWFKYDRRHDFSIILQYKLKKHFDFSVSWLYGSGNRMTMPTAKFASDYTVYYVYEEEDEPKTGTQGMSYEYGPRNAYVLPAFHHLDIGMNYYTKGKRVTHNLNVSVYNIYNRLNVFSVYEDSQREADGTRRTRYMQVSLFPILPSISYTIHFEK